MGYLKPFSKRITKSQPYGSNPNNGINPPAGHNGDDYRTPVGTGVRAACDGVIAYSQVFSDDWENNIGWNTPGGGLVVWLQNNEGTLLLEYGHLSHSLVKPGQRVKRGDIIAITGNSGYSTGPHCHVGVMPTKPNMGNGSYGRVRPDDYLTDYWEDEITLAPQSTEQDEEMSQEKLDKIITNQETLIGQNKTTQAMLNNIAANLNESNPETRDNVRKLVKKVLDNQPA